MARKPKPNVPQTAVPAMAAPAVERDNPLTRSWAGMIGMGFLSCMMLACLVSLFWTLRPAPATYPGVSEGSGVPRYNAGSAEFGRLPPWWAVGEQSALRLNALVPEEAAQAVAQRFAMTEEAARLASDGEVARAMREQWVYRGNRLALLLGTDVLGRSLLYRVLTGGGISLGIGLSAAFISVLIGTLYGAVAGYAGGKTDAAMMRVVDVLFGLPYILLVVLLAVASDAALEEYVNRQNARESWERGVISAILQESGIEVDDTARRLWRAQEFDPSGTLIAFPVREDIARARERAIVAGATSDAALLNGRVLNAMALAARPPRSLQESTRLVLDLVVLLVAIGGVSWLTMSRVIRGQVLSLKNLPFIEAARSAGAPTRRIFAIHLLPNLMGPIIVYATLTVPLAILQESFLSFLGIGVKPPLPSWGNLAADGLNELNPYQSQWWLILFPCLLLGATLLALNFVGEGLREAFDPKRGRR
ncbi:MAG: ABC transporter permease [Phycisphaeraceae bacterium]|nr:ABC transporter permease [Phycisphaeraceae bacterium]